MRSTIHVASLEEGVIFVNDEVSGLGRELVKEGLYIEFTWDDAVRIADAPWPQPRCCRVMTLAFLADVGPKTAAQLARMAFE